MAKDSQPSTLRLTAACRTGGYGPTWATAPQTAFAWTRKTPSGTRTSPTSVVCAFAKVVRYCRRSTWIVVASLAHSEALTGGRCSWWQPSGVVLRAWQAEHERARCSSLRRPHRAPVGRRRGAARRRGRRVRQGGWARLCKERHTTTGWRTHSHVRASHRTRSE